MSVLRALVAPSALEAIEGRFRDYLAIDDPSHIRFALAVAVGSHDDTGEPLWGLLVGAPSSGKTESLRALDDVANEHLDEITGPGLLSWVPGKDPRPTGLLSRHTGRVFATVGDLSTLLAKSDRGDRDQLYALLRRAYDGRVSREVGNAPRPLRWEGRLTLLAAVTPAVDRYTSHSDELGPRWLYLRIPPASDEHRRAAAKMMRASARHLERHRADVRGLVTEAVRDAATRHVTLDEHIGEQLDDAAIVSSLGRAAIPRDGYGIRQIIGIPTIEEPPRLVAQLEKLTRSALALGLTETEATALAMRAALDSMPQARRTCLDVLAGGEELGQREVARRAGIDRFVARMALEDLAAVGLATYVGADTDDDQDERRRGPWRLDGPDAHTVIKVVAKCVPPTPIPQ